jgi:nucleolar GTP-binding protein
MVLYNFKQIQVVPTGQDFIDIALSKTQRKTPTVIHKHYAIARIRQFYMKKVKFTQQTYHDRLTQILEDFPVLDDIHPFYADLINVLYDRDHYKLALGQLNIARHLIDNLSKDYVRLLKFGDSLYRCKQLKRAALGRMCTLMKKQGPSLAYLEQVRQHLARLPSIDPNTRSMILCGYPNVGKSSFMNKLTRADVDVQPYAFTTKSLFVGHADYEYMRFQVLDTPGILDHPLEERNTIEMLSITALAHLRAAIIFVIDISEQCSYSIEDQVKLFNSIKPLFINKPLVVALNKIDVITFDNLREDARALLRELETQNNVYLIPMSTLTEEGVMQVKEFACKKLLEQRLDQKLATVKQDDVLRRLHVAVPLPRDSRQRRPVIPKTVFQKRQLKKEGVEEMEREVTSNAIDLVHKNRWLMAETDPDWDPTVFGPDLRNQFMLANDEWKFDSIPEIINGMNVFDYIDPDILVKLRQLEKEEEERVDNETAEMDEELPFRLTDDEINLLKEMRNKDALTRMEHALRTSKSRPTQAQASRTGRLQVGAFEDHLKDMGIDPSAAVDRARSKSRGRKRSRSESPTSLARSKSHQRSKTPQEEGLRDKRQKMEVEVKAKLAQKRRNRDGRMGEADRHVYDLMPKHLYTGKRGNGKTERR